MFYVVIEKKETHYLLRILTEYTSYYCHSFICMIPLQLEIITYQKSMQGTLKKSHMLENVNQNEVFHHNEIETTKMHISKQKSNIIVHKNNCYF